jgi:hypothetical protein
MNSRQRLFIGGLLAISVVGTVATTFWKSADARSHAVEPPPILQRRIASVHIHGLPTDQAIEKLKKQTGMKIAFRGQSMTTELANPSRCIWLDFDDVPVDDLMGALTEQLGGLGGSPYAAEYNSVVIGPYQNLRGSLGAYDFADLMPSDSPEIPGELYRALHLCLQPRFEWSPFDEEILDACFHKQDSRLWILLPDIGHEHLRTFFSALRTARPDGSGPSIPRCRVIAGESIKTEIRFYDVRGWSSRARFTNGSPTWGVVGADGLASLVCHRGSDSEWNEPGKVICAGGRLIVEQTPAVQQEVRKTLADAEAGKPIAGFQLLPGRF